MDGTSNVEGPKAVSILRKPNLSGLRQRVLDRLRPAPETPTTPLHPVVFEAPKREVNVVNGHEYLVSLSPHEAAYEFTAEDWRAWFAKNLEDFSKEGKGTQANAGILMHEFVAGINDMHQEHLKRGNKFPKPKVKFDLIHDNAYSRRDNTVGIGKGYLFPLARKPINIEQPIPTSSVYADIHNLSFYGTTEQHIRSIGVHETDHAEYWQTHPATSIPMIQQIPGTMVQGHHDSLPFELRALEEQALHAERMSLPKRTVDVLKERIATAKKFQEIEANSRIIRPGE